MITIWLKNRLVLLVALVILMAAAGFAGMFFYVENSKASASSKRCDGYCIELRESADPEVVTVINGSYVQFNAADGRTHNVALEHAAVQHDDPSEYESGDFGADEGWKVQFKKDGAYTFRDKYNPKSHVNVIVYTPDNDYQINDSVEKHDDGHAEDGHSH